MPDIKKEVIDKIKSLYVDCPSCEYLTEDEQYTCTTCWNEGGNGKINVLNFLKENPELIWKKKIC